jgi:putative flippase GtrA
MKINRWLEELRYFRAGIINTALSYFLFTLVLGASNSALLALIVVSIVGSVISYNTSKHYVFRRKHRKSLVHFGYLQLLIICSNWLLLHLVTLFGASRNIAQVFFAVTFAALNFFICKNYIFKIE